MGNTIDLRDAERNAKTLATADPAALLVTYRNAITAKAVDQRVAAMAKAGAAVYVRTGRGGWVAQAAMASAIRKGHDSVLVTPTALAVVLSLGMTPEQVFLGVLGRAADPSSGGRTLPQHWGSSELGLLSVSPTPGAHLPHALGLAHACTRRADGSAAIAWLDDEGAADGQFFETVALAVALKAPLVIVWEQRTEMLTPELEGMHLDMVDGSGAISAYITMREALQRAANREGPTLLVVDCAEADRDLSALRTTLTTTSVASEAHLLQLESSVQHDIDEVADFAHAALRPMPRSAVERVSSAVRVLNDRRTAELPVIGGVERSVADALRDAQRRLLADDEDVVVVGRSLPPDSSLVREFGSERIVDIVAPPRSLIGMSVGMAMAGMRPIVRLGYAGQALDGFTQIANEAAWLHFRTNGELDAPIVFRLPWGSGLRMGPYHARAVEAFFAHIPGLIVVAPSTPADAAGMLAEAVATDAPVVFCEHRLVEQLVRGPVPEGEWRVPLGRASVVRSGTDLTVITYGALRHTVMRAAEEMARNDGVSVEVVDLRTISPLDSETLIESVMRTRRALIVYEDTASFGVGAEIAATLAEEAFDELATPIRRLALPDVPASAFAAELDGELVIGIDQVLDAARSMLLE